ncbi:unnamed protein product [Scytosiphon promiscuus]
MCIVRTILPRYPLQGRDSFPCSRTRTHVVDGKWLNTRKRLPPDHPGDLLRMQCKIISRVNPAESVSNSKWWEDKHRLTRCCMPSKAKLKHSCLFYSQPMQFCLQIPVAHWGQERTDARRWQ